MPGCSPRQYLVVYWCLVSLALLCYLNAQAGCFTLLTSRDHQAATPASKQGLGVCTPEGSTIKPLSLHHPMLFCPAPPSTCLQSLEPSPFLPFTLPSVVEHS